MCGLCGFWDPAGLPAAELIEIVSSMADTLRHRGPDDRDVWVAESRGLALGFRRLAILDLTVDGRQPMHSGSDRFVVVFNGELYNFRTLRDELAGRGHVFRGRSDTEVMLAAFEEWGIDDAVRRFVGMFAFAVWDAIAGELTLGRDRLGIKPLYYGYTGGVAVWGSELRAILRHPRADTTVDQEALTLFVRHNYVPSDRSIWREIRQLAPGSLLTVSRRAGGWSERSRPYWSVTDVAQQEAARRGSLSFAGAVDELDRVLREAVRLRMVSDVPLGAFLSGGIDSSTVVAMMQAQSSAPIRTFSIGFDDPKFDEAGHAAAVARHLGTDHTQHYVSAADALATVARLPEVYDEPFADSSQIPTLLLCELTRRSVTVSLSGDGGDELFAGYPRYAQAASLWRIASLAPPGLRVALTRGFDRLLSRGNETPLRRKGRRLAELLGSKGRDELYLKLVSHTHHPSNLVVDGVEPQTRLNDPARWSSLPSFVEEMTLADLQSYLPDDILTKVDRASMAASLEARVPMLDHRVVEFAWRLPLSFKDRPAPKAILREVLRRYVPSELFERPKMGFGVPLSSWLRHELRDWSEALLDPTALRHDGRFHVAPVRKLWNDHVEGKHERPHLLWNILMFRAWSERWSSRGKRQAFDSIQAPAAPGAALAFEA